MGQTSYYHYDGQGSAQCLTDENGNITDQYCNTAFGEPVPTGAANPTTNPFRYEGREGYYLDLDTGDYYVRARTYSPVLARWLSIDPADSDPNPYSYCVNDPTRFSDPSGLMVASGDGCCCDEQMIQMQDVSAAMRAFYDKKYGVPYVGGGSSMVWLAVGTGDPKKCHFKRYKLEYTKETTGIVANDTKFIPDGPVGKPPFTVIQTTPPDWKFQDIDTPGLYLSQQQGGFPPIKDVFFFEYVVNSDGSINNDCCNVNRVYVSIN